MHRWSDQEIHERLYGGYYGEETRMDSSGYRAMVDDIKERLGVDDDPDYGAKEIFADVASHGADTGWSGFTYTAEIADFYDSHEDALEDMLYEYAQNIGADNSIAALADTPYTSHPIKTAVVWWALVEVALREVED